MFYTFGYKTGYIHYSDESAIRWQCGGDHGTAKSTHAAKLAITRAEKTRRDYWNRAHTSNLAERNRQWSKLRSEPGADAAIDAIIGKR